MELKGVAQLVREMEELDRNGITTFSEHVQQSMREDINTTEAYLNSKHISGDRDALGREKPFYNIVIAARNIWYRATDIDRKNIVVRATKLSDEVKAFLGTIFLHQWMKKSNFGKFLNDWGLSLSNHGSSIIEFIEKGDELHCEVLDWNNLIVDPIDFDNNIKIKKLWYTPAQLKRKEGYDKEMVDDLLDNLTTRKDSTGQQKDNKSGYIQVYEVHGELPLSFITDKESDEDTYVHQMHVLSFQTKNNSKDEEECYTLYRGREKQSPMMITHLIKKDGQTYTGGAPKNLFEAQWMVNHTQKNVKDHLDLASKIVFQTSDETFVGQNMLSSIENGDILKHKINEPLARLASSADVSALQAFKADWQNIANQINGISEAMQGQNAPSGTAWRLFEAQLQESHSLFELMTETKGLYLIEMMTRYVIPHIKKKLNNSDEIAAILEEYQIKQLDGLYVPNEVTRRINNIKKDTILSGELYDPGFEAATMAEANSEITGSLKGNQRFIKPSEIDDKTWKEVFDGMEWDLDIDVTGEGQDVKSAMATLTTVFQTIASNPTILQDPNIKMIFGKILSMSNAMSPLELQGMTSSPTPQMTQPSMQPLMGQMPQSNQKPEMVMTQ